MEIRHSGLGIASFVISLVIGILVFLAIFVAGVIEASTPGGMDDKSAGAIVLGLFIIAALFVDVVAFGLGIGGVCQKDRKKVLAVLGIVFSSATMIGTLLLMVLGLSG